MSDHLSWLEALLLSVKLRTVFVNARLTGEPDSHAVQDELGRHGSRLARRRWAAAVCDRARQLSARVLVPEDGVYPRRLLELSDPPAVLFARGDAALLHEQITCGLVGCRRGTERGRLTAERIGAALARVAVPVVSGLAYGIDAAAHRGCLAGGGRPIGVVGNGLDVVYPSGHLALQEDVAQAGCLVSEYAPGTPPRKWQFVARNRLIAALSHTLVLAEAGADSGALSTVDFMRQLHRDVLVVPGPVDCPHSAGSLAELREGATLVRGADDVLEFLGFAPEATASTPLGLDSVPRTAAEIAGRLGWPVERALAALTELELQGLALRTEGARYVAPIAPPRGPRPRRA